MDNISLTDKEIKAAEEAGLEKWREADHESNMGRASMPAPAVNFIQRAIANAATEKVLAALSEGEKPPVLTTGYVKHGLPTRSRS